MIRNSPLEGIRVLDFSTLLPGPLATLYLAQAGAEVIKVEPPGGDPLRGYPPFRNGKSVLFELLNEGKQSVALDLKESTPYSQLLDLMSSIDILIEQFRPGVMGRLQLDFKFLKSINPKLIYCSITGYGQTGPNSQLAGHDLNYQAWTGLLAMVGENQGYRAVPALIADIAGGAHAAVINILLALRSREAVGEGCHLDIAMIDGLYPFMLSGLAYWSIGNQIPQDGSDLLTGGSPRYQLYQTSDGRHLAVAPLEERFWQRFTERIELPEKYRSKNVDAAIVCRRVRNIISRKSAVQWEKCFSGEDVCCTVVRDLGAALEDPALEERKLFFVGDQISIDLLAIPTRVDRAQAPYYGRDNKRFGFLE